MKKLIVLFLVFSMIFCSCTKTKTKIVNVNKTDITKVTALFTKDEKQKLDDINYLCSHLEKNHGKMYRSISREKFAEEKNKVIAKIPQLRDVDFNYEVSHLLALLHDNNASCTIIPENEAQQYAMPIRFYKFIDGFYIIYALEEKYLGCKVTAVNDMSMNKIAEKMRYIVSAENDTAFYSKLPEYVMNIELLKYMKIIDDDKKIKFTISKDGRKQDVVLNSLKTNNGRISESFHAVNINKVMTDSLVKSFYSSKVLEGNVYYIQYNKCAEDYAYSINQLVSKIKYVYDRKKFKKIVVDFRYNMEVDENSLGNSSVFVPVIQEIQELSKHGVKVYELIGANTMGICITNCLQLKKYTNCKIVGSPTGTSVNPFISNGMIMMMPNSGLKFRFSSKYIENDKKSKSDAVYPDVTVNYTFDDAIEGEDLELKYVLKN